MHVHERLISYARAHIAPMASVNGACKSGLQGVCNTHLLYVAHKGSRSSAQLVICVHTDTHIHTQWLDYVAFPYTCIYTSREDH